MTFNRSGWCVAVTVFLGTVGVSAAVEAQPAPEVFIGYSFLQADPGGATFNGAPVELETNSMHGGEVSGTYFTSDQLGWDFAFVGENGTIAVPPTVVVPDDVDVDIDFRQLAFMGGPRVRLVRNDVMSVDVRALIGGAKGHTKAVAGLFALDANSTVLAASVGASLNLSLGRSFAFRAHPGVYVTRFGDAVQTSVRFATGIVFVY